jgi:hypothetical protein
MRTDVGFQSEDEDYYDAQDNSSDFHGHIHGVVLDRAVLDYAGRRWRVHSKDDHPQTFVCTPIDNDKGCC